MFLIVNLTIFSRPSLPPLNYNLSEQSAIRVYQTSFWFVLSNIKCKITTVSSQKSLRRKQQPGSNKIQSTLTSGELATSAKQALTYQTKTMRKIWKRKNSSRTISTTSISSHNALLRTSGIAILANYKSRKKLRTALVKKINTVPLYTTSFYI